jgi:flagellin
MRINTNVSALNALSNLNKVQDAVSSSMQKLSSGFRINKAGDDAAGLGIANQMNADIKAMQQTSRNAEQAGSVLQIMDGATSNLQTILERMKELAAQSASDTVDSTARSKIDNEFGSLTSELDRIVATTKFQGASLLDGTFGSNVTVGVKSAADGSSFISGSVASTSVIPTTGAATYATITGDVTATVTSATTAGTNVGSVAGAAVAVTTQATVNGLTGSSISVASTFKQSDIATASANGIVAGVVSGVAVGSGGTDVADAQGLAAGTYTVKETAAASGGSVSLALYDSGGTIVAGSTTSFADNATSLTFAGTGVTLTLGANTTATALETALGTGKDLTVAQEYDVALSGGGATTQTQTLTDSGANTSATTFANFGVSLVGPTGHLGDLDATTISLTSAYTLKLDGTNAGGAVTESHTLAANPASSNIDFTSFGLRVGLGSGATGAAFETAVTGGANKIKQGTDHQAQFLVSSSQSYTGNDLISLGAIDLTGTTLGVNRTAVDLTTGAGAQAALSTIDNAITLVGNAIGAIGASENRVMYADQNVKTAIQNFTAAQSAIKDVDMADEMTSFSKNQILSQAGTAMLAQANQLGSSVLKLLQ